MSDRDSMIAWMDAYSRLCVEVALRYEVPLDWRSDGVPVLEGLPLPPVVASR